MVRFNVFGRNKLEMMRFRRLYVMRLRRFLEPGGFEP